MALHDLAAVAIRSGKGKEAERYVRAALQAYGAGHPELPALAHEVAYFWMTQGHFVAALRVFRALRPSIIRPINVLYLLSSIARAAGGASEREVFEAAWMEAQGMLDEPAIPEGSAGALLELARGAASLDMWDWAEKAAQHALLLATQRGEAEFRLGAEAILESVRHDRAAKRPQEKINAPIPEPVSALASDLIAYLKASPATAAS